MAIGTLKAGGVYRVGENTAQCLASAREAKQSVADAEVFAAEAFSNGIHTNQSFPGGPFTTEEAGGLIIETVTPDGGKYEQKLYRPGKIDGYGDKIDVFSELDGLQAVAAGSLSVTANTAALRTAIRNYGFYPAPSYRLADVPTLTVGEANVSSINGAMVSMADARVTSACGIPVRFSVVTGQGFPDTEAFSSFGGYYGPTAGNTGDARGATYSAFEFKHNGDVFEVSVLGKAGGSVRVIVDNAVVGSVTTPNEGNGYYIAVRFPAVAEHRIRVESSGAPFLGVKSASLTNIKATGRVLPIAAVMGDSFVESTGAALGDGEAAVMCRALGLSGGIAGVGGSGMINPGGANVSGGQKVNFANAKRLVDLTLAGVTSAQTNLAAPPAIGIVFGTMNDAGLNASVWAPYGATLQAAITRQTFTIIDAWVAANPGKPLVFFGPTWPSGPPNNRPPLDVYRIRDGIAEAAAAMRGSNAHFLDRMMPHFREGEFGDTADQAWLYTGGVNGADPTHPTPTGHRFDGLRCAVMLRDLIMSELA